MLLAQLIGLLKAPQQIPQRGQHLISQGIADHGLEAAALLEHVAEPVAIGIQEHMALAQEQIEAREHQPAAHFSQFAQPEGEMARAFTLGGHHQPQLAAVEQQTRFNARFPQQSLQPFLR